MTNYTQQAEKFLQDTKTTLKADFTEHRKHFDTDKETRDVYTVTLTREGKKPFIFSFGQSIANSGTITEKRETTDKFKIEGGFIPKPTDFKRNRTAPTAYDVLASLTKNEVGSFDDFCSDFGYDNDSRTAEKVYIAVQKEYSEVKRLFNDVMDALQEIA
jgi:hypothetical protein